MKKDAFSEDEYMEKLWGYNDKMRIMFPYKTDQAGDSTIADQST